MSGRLICVRSLARAIASWRGRATLRLRFFECMSENLDLVVLSHRLLDVVDGDLPVLGVEEVLSASLAVSRVMSRPLKRE